MSIETIKKHGGKVAGSAATGSIGGVVAWALMTFTPIVDHKETRREVQALREATGPILWDYEHNSLPCSCAGHRRDYGNAVPTNP